MVVDESEGEEPPIVYDLASTSSPICFRVPPEALAPGQWSVMTHSEGAAVDVRLHYTVTWLGGAVTFNGEDHRYTAPELVDTLATMQKIPPLPCGT